MRIGYARVSRLDQNPELQRIELERAGCAQIVVEHGSGAKKDRPGLIQVLELLRPGDCLVVWKIDRLSRSLLDLIQLMNTLGERHVDIVSLHDPIDTTSAFGVAMFQMIGVFAQLERAMIIERTNPGLAAARAKGHVGGARRKLYGAKLERAKAMIAEGKLKQGEIAKVLGVSRSTLVRYAIRDGRPRGQKLLEKFLERHPDADAWLKESAVPNYRDNPDKAKLRRAG